MTSQKSHDRPAAPPGLPSRFACLTGIRGLAILWVVFVHLPVELGHAIDRARETWGIGVDTFLAVSGFLVTRSLLLSDRNALASGGSRLAAVGDFLARRGSRILPSYFAFIALLAAIALLLDRSLADRVLAVPGLLPGLFLFCSNYPIGVDFSRVPVVVSSLWSLALQEQFYLLLAACYLLARRRLATAIAGLAALSIALRLGSVLGSWGPWAEGHPTSQLQAWTHFRLDAIGWAALAWIHYRRLGALWATPARARAADASLALGWIALLAITPNAPGSLNQALIYAFKAPLLALTIRRVCELDSSSGALASALRSPRLAAIGIAAYEIYLLNPVIMAILVRALPGEGPVFAAGRILGGVIASVASGLVAYRLLGKPAQQWLRSRLTRERAKLPGAPAAETPGA